MLRGSLQERWRGLQRRGEEDGGEVQREGGEGEEEGGAEDEEDNQLLIPGRRLA